MDFIIMDDLQKVGPLKNRNVCPYCGERTAIKLESVCIKVGNVHNKQETKEFVGCFCKNMKCNMYDKQFHIPKDIYDK